MIVVFSIDFLRTMGPVDLAYEMQTSTSWVIYHLRILEMAGLLETAGEKLNYEGYERFFRLVEQPPPGPPATPR